MENGNYTSLMERRVRRILLVCNNYDSFALEEDFVFVMNVIAQAAALFPKADGRSIVKEFGKMTP